MSNLVIPQPPREIFEKDLTPTSLVTHEDQPIFMIERVDYPETGGIYIYKFGGHIEEIDGKTHIKDAVRCLYPEKGFPTPEAVSACNAVKAALMLQLKMITRKPVLICLSLLIFLPYKSKLKLINHWLGEFHGLSSKVLTPYFYNDRYLSNPAKEIKKFLEVFISKLGIEEGHANSFARTFAHLIEYDTAYRYRMEDIMSETGPQTLKNAPGREIRRLMEVFATRDLNKTTQEKFGVFGILLRWLLVLPKVKRAFREAISAVDFPKLQLDEADRYHVLKFDRYNFMGRSLEDRFNEYMNLHGGFPPVMYNVSNKNLIPINE